MLRSWLLHLVLLLTSPCYAQLGGDTVTGDAGAQTDSEYTLLLGDTLHSQIDNITEIQPNWMIAYAFRLGPGKLEPFYYNSNANQVRYEMFGASYRYDIDSADLTVFAEGGLAAHYYQASLQDVHYKLDYGFHTGGGFMFLITQALWFRLDMRFYLLPGFSFYYGLGVDLRLPGT